MLPMKADLQELMISNGEINNCTGYGDIIEFIMPTLSAIYNLKLSNIPIIEKIGHLRTLLIYIIVFIMIIPLFVIGIYPLYDLYKAYNSSVYQILQSIEKHNQIINNLHTLDQLAEVGNPVKINDRSAVIEALKITRDGLVRALKTERILRENSQFRPEHFNIDLSYIQAETAEIKAIEYAELLNDALQIGVSVQTEMRKLQNKR